MTTTTSSLDYSTHVAETTAFNEAAKRNNPYNQMKCPNLIGNLNDVTFNSIYKVITNVQSYGISYPISGWNPDFKDVGLDENNFYRGPDYSLSSNYFEKLGVCSKETSDPICQDADRYVYIRNIPTGKIPILNNVSFEGITGCNLDGLTESRGLLDGLLEDISDIQAFDIEQAYEGKGNYGSNQCKLMSFPVGTHIYDSSMEGKTWQNLQRCTSSWSNLKEATDGKAQLYPSATPWFGNNDIRESFENKNSFYTFLLCSILLVLAISLIIFLYK